MVNRAHPEALEVLLKQWFFAFLTMKISLHFILKEFKNLPQLAFKIIRNIFMRPIHSYLFPQPVNLPIEY